MNYQCQYCKKTFVKESTLTSHVCERKRRFQQQHEIGVQWGFQAYNIFYKSTQSNRDKSYEEFVDSSYYTAFVRFGRHAHSVHCPNFVNYTRWLLKNNKKLDKWTSESLYSEWLQEYLRRENVNDALERSLQFIIDYTHDHADIRNGYRDYFRLVNENRICYHITTGRISAWIVYHSQSGQEFLNRLNDDQVATIIDYIDPGYWQSLFKDHGDSVQFAQNVLRLASL